MTEASSDMFDSIAWRYDFLNHLLSFGIDRYWRRKAIGIISESIKIRKYLMLQPEPAILQSKPQNLIL